MGLQLSILAGFAKLNTLAELLYDNLPRLHLPAAVLHLPLCCVLRPSANNTLSCGMRGAAAWHASPAAAQQAHSMDLYMSK